MNANAVRVGLRRGWIEFRQTWGNRQDLMGYLLPTVILLGVLSFQRDAVVAGISLGATSVPGVLGMTIAFGGLVSLGQLMVTEREDGTLLRAKAVPHGMFGYLIGKLVLVTGMTLTSIAILLIPSLVMFEGFTLGIGSLLGLLGMTVLGLVATIPIGATIGSLFTSPNSMALIMLPMIGLIVISGIFFPVTTFPEWVQWIAQVFPVYWLGLGMRSALLPDEMMTLEIGESWRHLETIGVLGLWAVAGLVIAPVVLRRMARRESGSTVAARREKAMQRVV
ncbi:ABC-2 type transport system permease protein [Saccharopolyspora antimicrobica]|uniref:ABC-2 type transport system permease protein n=1 Tax=Saccharopolyspora antimicrobica TaxID=455193 RepID=A0A1I4ZJH7_9PSEU|nr:ABC transporter permease [Saccharopolyspora antimicrobica]RKT83502.1 ABC-2 type transport system permease protein [Saccharopolyspora antimicrobica]SFN50436.1 ABC-2 type transport system permease protein [Saccharopolyspora antimicrobica]